MTEHDAAWFLTEQGAEWFRHLFQQRYEERSREIGRFNVAIFGKTGVGKTTLLNAIFGSEAETGIGRPVTQDNHLYLHTSGHLGVLDTVGLEIGQDSDAIVANLKEYMDSRRHEPLEDQIHVAWYCVRARDNRFEVTEEEFVGALRRLDIPVFIVLTQVPFKDGKYHPDALALKAHIDKLSLVTNGVPAFLTYAKEDQFSGFPSHGLQRLLDATFAVAPEGVQTALTVAQKIDLKRKQEQAKKTIAIAVGAAGAAAATPIPFADAALLVPIQVTMMSGISIIYGIEFDKATTASIAATAAATAGGRALVANLLMFVPGVGQVTGAVISAGVATSFTWAMGQAWTVVCARISKGELQSVTGALDSEVIREAFMAEFRARVSLRNRRDATGEAEAADE